MKAVTFDRFGGPLTVGAVADPEPGDDDAVVRVEATGICRSDWHGWMGHDPDITQLPHVPGHELAGIVEVTGSGVTRWRCGERVTVPFVCGCGVCPECESGNHQTCDHQTQPGFTHWGSFAERVLIKHADTNLVALPDSIDLVTGASLGCRFATAFRAVVDQGRVTSGEWVVVHGCGGVGLSAVMIASALDAQVIAVDIGEAALKRAKAAGATVAVNAAGATDVPAAVRDIIARGADVSIDALGSAATASNSLECLRKRGRHLQVGLLSGEDHRPPLPMEQVIARELEIRGSHGMSANGYAHMLELVEDGKINPARLVGKTIALEEAADELERMGRFETPGITVIDRI